MVAEEDAAAGGGTNFEAPGDKIATARLSAQLKKLTEANSKYKNLLKLAKERIQLQEEEIENIRQEKVSLEERLEKEERDAGGGGGMLSLEVSNSEPSPEEVAVIARVRQRVRVPVSPSDDPALEEIWALLEMEAVPHDMVDSNHTPRRYKEWRRFGTESELQDFIRRDTGEPLTLPPYSLSPEQSARIERDASVRVSQITEEFRRFRVRSELARKQADAQIRDLQSNHVQSAQLRIEGHDLHQELEQARSAGGQVERLRAELAAQEAHWKEAYDVLLAENNALKSAGSEALLAAQWRQRYEACLQEKDDLESRLKMEMEKSDNQADADKYEMKYRDLKESFRLYRKKAKEIFEAQQRDGGGGGVGADMSAASGMLANISDASSADAKLSYLKNLMVNYLSSDQAVRDHMETAIQTVLQFTSEEKERIKEKRAEADAWF